MLGVRCRVSGAGELPIADCRLSVSRRIPHSSALRAALPEAELKPLPESRIPSPQPRTPVLGSTREMTDAIGNVKYDADFYPGVYPERSRRGGELVFTNTVA